MPTMRLLSLFAVAQLLAFAQAALPKIEGLGRDGPIGPNDLTRKQLAELLHFYVWDTLNMYGGWSMTAFIGGGKPTGMYSVQGAKGHLLKLILDARTAG